MGDEGLSTCWFTRARVCGETRAVMARWSVDVSVEGQVCVCVYTLGDVACLFWPGCCLWCWYGGGMWRPGEIFWARKIIKYMGQESHTFAGKVQVLPERVLEIISAVHRKLSSNRTRLSVCRSNWVFVVSSAHPVDCF